MSLSSDACVDRGLGLYRTLLHQCERLSPRVLNVDSDRALIGATRQESDTFEVTTSISIDNFLV